jgi:hypothetical protein
MAYRVRTAATVIIGSDPPVAVKAGSVRATADNAAALELLTTLGIAELVEEEESNAAEP